jgi:hypothetical protein
LEQVEASYGKQFTEDRFKQILSLVPDLYLHKWDIRQGRPVLLVDMPQNIVKAIVSLRTGDDEAIESVR